MPFERPTLTDLIERAAADIETRLPSTDARLRRSNLDILGKVHAGATHGLYGFLQFLSRQFLPDTAEGDYLQRLADIWEISRLAATQAQGPATATGNDGAIIPAGSVLQRSDGARFEVDADATIATGTAVLAVTAEIGGVSGNTSAGSVLTFISPLANIASAATVASGGIKDGVDVQSDESLRAAVLRRIRQPPHGGTVFDYETWTLNVPGVTRAWVSALELGANTVVIRFVIDDDPGGLIPDVDKVAEVQAYIDTVRPVTAGVFVAAPISAALDLTITGLSGSGSLDAVKAAITDELTDMLRREATPGGTVLISHLREAISLAAGELDHVLTLPAGNVTHPTGHLAVLGDITWA